MKRRSSRLKPSIWLYYAIIVALSLLSILSVTVYSTYLFKNAATRLAQEHVGISGGDWAEVSRRFDEIGLDVLIDVVGLAVILCLLMSGVCYLLYRWLQPPLLEMRLGAERFAKGEFDQKLPEYRLREIAKLATAMNKMGSQLHHLEAVRRDFVANVSHELKTPVTSIKGFVETLLDGAMDEREDLQRFLEIVGKQADRLGLIVEDLLTLARLESVQIEEMLLAEEELLHKVLDTSVAMCSDVARLKDISIEVQCSSKLRGVFDRSLLEQAVGNLISNAIKYSGPSSSISVKGNKLQDLIEISVTDQGPGIGPEHLPRLFERFYRIDKARSRTVGGTGLGLAIVKHIASVHGGSVEVRSTLGKGSTFFIRIPVC